MRQHRIVGSQRRASQVPLSQSYDLHTSQHVPVPPLRSESQSQRQFALSQPHATQRANTPYEVPAPLQRSLIRPPPPVPPAAVNPLTAALSNEHILAHTRAVVTLTETLAQTHRDDTAQHDAHQLVRSQAIHAQERLVSVLSECVTELRALREALTAKTTAALEPAQAPAPRVVAPNVSRESVAPHPCQRTGAATAKPGNVTSQITMAPVRFVGDGRAQCRGVATSSVASPQLFPEPVTTSTRPKRAAAAPSTQSKPLKRARHDAPSPVDETAAASHANSESQVSDAARSRDPAPPHSNLSFFQDSGDDGVYLL